MAFLSVLLMASCANLSKTSPFVKEKSLSVKHFEKEWVNSNLLWREDSLGLHGIRRYIYYSMISRYDIEENMTISEVKEYLGEPNSYYDWEPFDNNKNALVYYLKYISYGMRAEYIPNPHEGLEFLQLRIFYDKESEIIQEVTTYLK